MPQLDREPHRFRRNRIVRATPMALLVATATLVALIAAAAPVVAQAPIVIELTGTMGRPVGTIELLTSEPVAPRLVGASCGGVAETEGSASVHPGNNVIVETGLTTATFFGVEDTPGQITEMSGLVVLGDTIDIYFEWGPDETTDLGIVITIECAPVATTTTSATTTTTTTTTTMPPPTSTTTTLLPSTSTTTTTTPPASTTSTPPSTTPPSTSTTLAPTTTVTLPTTSGSSTTLPTTSGSSTTLPTTSGSSTTVPPTSTTAGAASSLALALQAATAPGRFLFNPPAVMQINQTERIEVRMTRAGEEEVSNEALAEGLEGGGEPAVEALGVTEEMKVRLSGRGFDIVALTAEKQIVGDLTQWDFDVTPVMGGDLTLVLSIDAVVRIPGQEPAEQSVPAIEKGVSVAVSTVDQVGRWWNSAGTRLFGVLVALAGVAGTWYAIIADRRGKSGGTAAAVAPRPAGPVRVFVSYRRDDTAGWAGRIHDQLSARFGADQVFMDVEDIDYGVDFESTIHRRILESEALVVLIGPRWLNIADESGARRLDDKGDYIVMEIRLALAEGRLVIPVLVDGATMPDVDSLPEPIQELARRNALTVDAQRFEGDTERLMAAIEQSSEDEGPPSG